jgi:cell division protein FtsB
VTRPGTRVEGYGRAEEMARSRRGRGKDPFEAVDLKAFVIPGLLAVAVYYGVFGGEYSIFDLRSVRTAVDVERGRLLDVHLRIDSLTAWADSLQSDPATIERVAREDFGMIRDGETLYRFAEADSEPSVPDTPER